MKVKLENNRNEIELGNIKYGELFIDPVNEEMGLLMRINPDSVEAKLTSFSKVIAVSLEDGEVYGFGPEDRVVNLVEGEFRGRY